MITIDIKSINGFEEAVMMASPQNSDSVCLFHMMENWEVGKDPEIDKKYNDILDFGVNVKLGKQDATKLLEHPNYLKYIKVTSKINAPIYWWEEVLKYSLMSVEDINELNSLENIIAKSPFTSEDFSAEQGKLSSKSNSPFTQLDNVIEFLVGFLNFYRQLYLKECKMEIRAELLDMIKKLLPSCYNKSNLVCLTYYDLRSLYVKASYEVLTSLNNTDWKYVKTWIESLPYSEELLQRY